MGTARIYVFRGAERIECKYAEKAEVVFKAATRTTTMPEVGQYAKREQKVAHPSDRDRINATEYNLLLR